MKSKTHLTLMELLIMVLVFAVAAALCLQAFAGAERISANASALDRAVLEAQNTAETLKACSGDFEDAALLCGGVWDGSCWTRTYEGGTLQSVPLSAENSLLGQAEITVFDENGTPIYALTAAWQRGGTDHG